MDPAVRERVKLEISFVLAKEHIPFLKYPAIHELEDIEWILGQHIKIKILPAVLFTTLLRAKDDNCTLAWFHFTFTVS